jgi:hypothetical protein
MCSGKAAHVPRFVRCQSIRQRPPTPGTQSNALDRIEGRYAGPNTKLDISVVAVCTSPTITDRLSSPGA